MNFRYFKTLLFLLFLLLIVLIFVPLNSVYAQTQDTNFSTDPIKIPQQSGTLQVEIPKAYFVKGILWVDLKLKNDSSRPLNNIMYGLQILSPKTAIKTLGPQGETDGISAGWLTGYQDYNFFNLGKGESLEQKIEYKLGSSFKSGVYTVLIQIKSADGQILGYQAQTFNLIGDGKFLEFNPDNCDIGVGTAVYDTDAGPVINPQDQGSLICEISNPSEEKIDVHFKIEHAISSVSLNPNVKIESSPVKPITSLEPGEIKKVSFDIPKLSRPQVYEGLLYLLDSNANKIAPLSVFRWTVPGASATILSVNADKDSYSQGWKALVKVDVEPSADLPWRERSANLGTDLQDASLKVSLIAKDGSLCGEAVSNLPKTSQDIFWGETTAIINIEKNCPIFTVKTQILNNGEVLTETEKPYGIQIDNPTLPDSRPAGISEYMKYAILGVVLAVVIVAVILWKRKKGGGGISGPQTPPEQIVKTAGLILVLGLVFSLSSDVKADTILAPVNDPIENKTVTAQDPNGNSDWRFWANVSNFQTASGSAVASASAGFAGRSTVITNKNCDLVTLYIHGYASATHCRNFEPGIRFRVFIDGQPIDITSATSSESKVEKWGEFIDLLSRPGGLRTGTALINIPPALQTNGPHKIEVQVGASGVHNYSGGQRERMSSFEINTKPCGKGEPCYMLMSTNYSCNKCPVGQDFPHYVCDPALGTCKAVNECGVSTCKPGNNDCTNCDSPNELKPHMACVNNSCTEVAACGAPSCNSTADCCPAGQSYDSDLDKCVTPACNVACPDDTFCQGSKDGCKYCVKDSGASRGSCQRCPNPGETNPHGTCDGVACRQVNTCGVTSCTANAQCFSDDMCKCDGMVADIKYPSSSFNFEAYGKVEGTDTSKAEIADITFRMTRDNQVIAKSNPIPPQIVETSSEKVRFKASWSTPPPALSKDAVYRVFADVRCKPKKAGTVLSEESEAKSIKIAESVNLQPKGLKWILNKLTSIFGTSFSPIVKEVLAQLSSPSPSGTTVDQSLQLRTLNFVKLMETDNCRFVMFKYDETLF